MDKTFFHIDLVSETDDEMRFRVSAGGDMPFIRFLALFTKLAMEDEDFADQDPRDFLGAALTAAVQMMLEDAYESAGSLH